VRRVLFELLPGAEERVYPGWHGIGYVLPDHGYIGGIFPRTDEVRLGFENGYAVQDPQGLLIVPGTRVAYLAYRSPEDIDRSVIEDFLTQLLED
jgi:hypothetical protein